MTEDTLASMGPEAMGPQVPSDKRLGGTVAPGPEGPGATDKKLIKDFKNRIELCKQYRRKLIANWVSNIDYRRGKPFASQTDEDRVTVNLDWSMTKAKIAALFSQVPKVHINHPPQTTVVGPGLYGFELRLNDNLQLAGIETVMEEVLPDVINAAGIGGAMVSYEAITEEVEVPGIDFSLMPPQMAQQIQSSGVMPDGSPIPMVKTLRVNDKRYVIKRISPGDLLWPLSFNGADFDFSPWIGQSGRTSWATGKVLFNLKDEDKAKIVQSDTKNLQDKLTHDVDKDKMGMEEEVIYDEIFFKEHYYVPDTKTFSSIRRMVFVAGMDEPVVDELWKGQRLDPSTGQVVGATKFPLRVLTLTYISDETIPPSDSAIGRPQVNELNKSRTQMILQRERSLPIRWFDVNRIDPTIQQGLMRGTWQAMIPVQGAGDKTIGEVARASQPQENFTFDQIAKNDLNEAWQIGPNQQGSFGVGRQSASEANVVESNFQTRVGRERAKVAKFFVSIAEVLGGLMCLYEDPAIFGEGFDPKISSTLSYSILADSTVLLDSNQRVKRLMDFLNMTAKSGWVDVGPVIKEIATLSGLDPNQVVRPPQPAPPAEPNISLRLTGLEDLLNPLPLAMMLKSGQAPEPELIEKAKQLIQLSVTPPAGGTPAGGVPAPSPQALGTSVPSPPPPGVGEANSEMGLMPKVNARSDQEGLG